MHSSFNPFRSSLPKIVTRYSCSRSKPNNHSTANKIQARILKRRNLRAPK